MAIVGIDLGTTNSLIAIWQNEEVTLIPNVHGDNLTPSVVSVDDNGEILVGKPAKERLFTHPQLSVETFKRKMGGGGSYQLGKQKFTPVELSALVIKSLISDAQNYLGTPVTEAVISVPAYFNDIQRNATKAAGEIAGLKVERLINEPTAAAVAYGLHDVSDDTSFIVVDLGGGTFDVSLMELFNDVMEVHASAGDTFLGGEDFSSVIEAAFLSENNIDRNKLSIQEKSKIKIGANQLKLELSHSHSAELSVNINNTDVDWTLTRDQFNSRCEPLINKLRVPIERVLRDSHMTPSNLSNIILVGGATRMPMIKSSISKMFRRLPSCTINPDEVVARGAAIQAALKGENRALKDVVLTDICPYTLGIEICIEKGQSGGHENGHFMPILDRNTLIPTSRVENIVTVADNQTELNIKIYQGESRLVKNNLLLGSLSVKVPKQKAGVEGVDIRFTYDINGILEAEATICSTGQVHKKIVEKTPGALSEKEIQDSLNKIQSLKVHPRDDGPNRATLARAERIYEQNTGDTRSYIAQMIQQFDSILSEQNIEKATTARIDFDRQLDELDGNLLQ